MDTDIIDLSHEKIIDELKKPDKESLLKDEKVYDIDLHTFFTNFNILEVALGTTIGFGLNKVLVSFSEDNLQPIIKKLFFNEYLSEISVFGIDFNIERTIGNLIYLFILIILVFILFKYGLRSIVHTTLKNKYAASQGVKEREAYKIALQKEQLYMNELMINKLEKLNNGINNVEKSIKKPTYSNY